MKDRKAAALFGIVMGGMFTGIFSPTEGASVGAFGAILLGFLQREAVMPSFHNVVGTTALSSLRRLATSMRSSPEQKARCVRFTNIWTWLG